MHLGQRRREVNVEEAICTEKGSRLRGDRGKEGAHRIGPVVARLGARPVKVKDLFAVAEEAAVEEGVGHEQHPDHHEHVEHLAEEELPEVDIVAVKDAPASIAQ